jgi:hypothetical protein
VEITIEKQDEQMRNVGKLEANCLETSDDAKQVEKTNLISEKFN